MQERKIIKNSKSWRDLDRTLKKLIKNKKAKLAGSIFEHLTKLYLEVSPEYKSKLNKVYLLDEVPTNLKKKLKLPNTDEGIDLIAETFDKEYWAIQCKYRSDNTETLKVKGDLATFNNLAFTVCKNISHGIVCATVNRPPKKTKLLNSIGFELLTTWLGLDRNDGELFKEIKSKAIGKIERPKKLNPRPHQVKAIDKTIDYFKSNERGKMIMPCGTGKSLTAFWIAEKMKPKSILVAVPSLALLQQTLKVWTREFLLNNIEPDWLCVCSDDTVKEEQDDFVTSSSDLGIKVDTDPRVIRNFLKKKTNKLKIVFTTYQSGRATAIGSKGFIYDLGIMDEAHKTVGSKSKEMAHLLHQKNIKINKRLFMTATERLFRGDSDEYMSMDDPRDYGNLIYELSFKEAINCKPPIISDYKIITFGITNPEIEAITQDNKYLEVKKELKDITARELATAIALRKAIKKLKIKNAISFHRSIKRADNFRKQQDLITKIYPDYGKLKTFHVKGDMPTSDRALEMLAFEEEQGLMTNARCLTEGVDLPAIDCVCFTDPKRSKVDIVQAAGRALRLARGKKFGYILIPIFIPNGMDFNEAAEEQGFNDVAVTVRALATTDKRIVEYLRAISEGKKPKGGSPVDGITSINQLYKVEAEEFNKAVQLKIWDKVAVGNYRSYEEAKAYVKELNLNTKTSWIEYSKSKEKPKDIPVAVSRTYRNQGWLSWGDFLGTENIPLAFRNYLTFEKAKEIVKRNNIKSGRHYKVFVKKNKNLPKKPSNFYKNEWTSWGDFLGTGKIADQYLKFQDYENAKKLIKKFDLRTNIEFKKFTRSNEFKKLQIPKHPNQTYSRQNKWKGWGDFLGTGSVGSFKKVLSFEKARTFMRSLKLNSFAEWENYKKFNKLPLNMPSGIHAYYSKNKKWKGLPDFMGSNSVDPYKVSKNFYSFSEAKKEVRKLNIKNTTEWKKFLKSGNRSLRLPSTPDRVYKNKGWVDWKDFFGNSEKKIVLNKKDDWNKFIKENDLPKDFPRDPRNAYKNDGFSWGDFLGSGRIATHKRNTASYEEAKKFAVKLNLKLKSDWDKYVKQNKLPINIPKTPQNVYRDKNFSWGDFLGTGRIANRNKVYRSYKEAKKYALSLKLKTFKEWKKVKLPDDIPRNFSQTYKNEFEGWPTVLGNGNEKVNFLKYRDAKKILKKMKFKNQLDYKKWWRSTKSKLNLPGDPYKVYSKDNFSWGDYLSSGYISSSKRTFASYDVAKKYLKKLNLSSKNHWKNYIKGKKLPPNIPRDPYNTYLKTNNWKGWPDFLGKE